MAELSEKMRVVRAANEKVCDYAGQIRDIFDDVATGMCKEESVRPELIDLIGKLRREAARANDYLHGGSWEE